MATRRLPGRPSSASSSLAAAPHRVSEPTGRRSAAISRVPRGPPAQGPAPRPVAAWRRAASPPPAGSLRRTSAGAFRLGDQLGVPRRSSPTRSHTSSAVRSPPCRRTVSKSHVTAPDVVDEWRVSRASCIHGQTFDLTAATCPGPIWGLGERRSERHLARLAGSRGGRRSGERRARRPAHRSTDQGPSGSTGSSTHSKPAREPRREGPALRDLRR